MDRNIRIARDLIKLAKALVGSDDVKALKRDIDLAKRRIEDQVKRNGICENLGADEVRALKDKYNVYDKEAGDLIAAFEDWCINYNL